MQIGPITPILRIFDEPKTRAFYVDFLGFTVEWEHRFEAGLPLYLEDMPWGTREMSVKDPFGNRLTFVDSTGADG